MLRKRTLLKQQPPAGDINTVLLLHLDGSVVDSSMYAVPVSQSSGSSFATGKFGQSFVGYFLTDLSDPSPIITPSGYINNVIASDFTIEMWIDSDSIDPMWGATLFYIGVDESFTNMTLSALISSAGGSPLRRMFSIMESVDDIQSPLIDQEYAISNYPGWFHFAITVSGTILRMFVNGVIIGTYSHYGENNDPTFTNSFLCCDTTKIDEIRISNIARWTANFTPPTEPYA